MNNGGIVETHVAAFDMPLLVLLVIINFSRELVLSKDGLHFCEFFMSLKDLIILSCKLHKGHSTEQVHHGRPTYRPGGHRDGPMSES